MSHSARRAGRRDGAGDLIEQMAGDLRAGRLTADELLSRYCAIVDRSIGSYPGVVRKRRGTLVSIGLGVDRSGSHCENQDRTVNYWHYLHELKQPQYVSLRAANEGGRQHFFLNQEPARLCAAETNPHHLLKSQTMRISCR